jgi:hypothetical protein
MPNTPDTKPEEKPKDVTKSVQPSNKPPFFGWFAYIREWGMANPKEAAGVFKIAIVAIAVGIVAWSGFTMFGPGGEAVRRAYAERISGEVSEVISSEMTKLYEEFSAYRSEHYSVHEDLRTHVQNNTQVITDHARILTAHAALIAEVSASTAVNSKSIEELQETTEQLLEAAGLNRDGSDTAPQTQPSE